MLAWQLANHHKMLQTLATIIIAAAMAIVAEIIVEAIYRYLQRKRKPPLARDTWNKWRE